MAGLERDDEGYFNKRVKLTGGETRKVKWLGRRGAPDRVAGWPHKHRAAFVELKHPDQPWEVQSHQMREINRLRSWGFDVRILEGRDQIDQFIEEMSK